MPHRTYVCTRCGVTATARSAGGKLPAHCDDCFLVVYGRRRDRSPRPYVCKDCGGRFEQRKGILPDRCPECRKPPLAKPLAVVYSCPDCGGELRSGKVRRCTHCGSGPSAEGVRFKPLKTYPGRSCKACGESIHPAKEAGTTFCSGACKEWARRRPGVPRPLTPTLVCEQCGEEFQPQPKAQHSKTKWCSPKCRARTKHLARPFGEWRKENPYPPRLFNCAECGVESWGPGGGTLVGRRCIFCQRRQVTAANLVANERRKAMIKAASVPGVVFTHREIFERDGWICQLCGDPVDPESRRPRMSGASLDHIVPLSKGGLHVPENVQLAHLICNIRKRDRIT